MKIVITDEVDDLITHNIFFAAIIRAQKELKIYWTPEVEKKVLEQIIPQNIDADVETLQKYIVSPRIYFSLISHLALFVCLLSERLLDNVHHLIDI